MRLHIAVVVSVVLLTLPDHAECSSSNITVNESGWPASTRFQPWANYYCDPQLHTDENVLCSPKQYSIGQWNRTATGGWCTTNGCAFYPEHSWTQGAFPQFGRRANDPMINGGVPQEGNLTYHLEQLALQIDQHIPQKDWAMHGVIDFEQWSPIWDDNTSPDGKRYKEYSLNLTRAKHPEWPEHKVEAITIKVFEKAATEFFVETLKTLRKLRPNVLWGFYDFPRHIWGRCADNETNYNACGWLNPEISEKLRRDDDRLADVWRNTGAFYPSIYLQEESRAPSADIWRRLQTMWVKGPVVEAARLANKYPYGSNSSETATTDNKKEKAKIVPFYTPRYKNRTTVDANEFYLAMEALWLPPHCTQVMVWMGLDKWELESNGPLMRDHAGPLFEYAVSVAQECSEKQCNSHGWCEPLLGRFNSSTTGSSNDNSTPKCVCDEGYHGATCDTQKNE